ncbi:DUF7537 family lipoprotein [Halobacterium wangiae]|uniref:DUF7537 family lipoprotein n=1 Tax=Halobacterium wangiae TaxID=2902623 RepID=UPI001E4FF842|nr:hypothetical protein [Halobacterium wangiae]
MRRPAATLAVAALLVAAGCSGGGDTTTTPEYDTDAEPIYETPLDAETVTDAHLDALRDHGTFTIDQNTTWEDSGGRELRTGLVRANLDSGAVYGHWKFRDDTRQTYQFADGTGYNRLVNDGELHYSRGGARTNATGYAKGGLLVVEVFTFDYAGTTVVDGDRVHVYQASGPDEVDTSAFPSVRQLDSATVDHAEATVHVREDGAFRRVAYTVAFENSDQLDAVSTTWRFEKLGDTDVSPPGWVSVARNRTDQSPASQRASNSGQ